MVWSLGRKIRYSILPVTNTKIGSNWQVSIEGQLTTKLVVQTTPSRQRLEEQRRSDPNICTTFAQHLHSFLSFHSCHLSLPLVPSEMLPGKQPYNNSQTNDSTIKSTSLSHFISLIHINIYIYHFNGSSYTSALGLKHPLHSILRRSWRPLQFSVSTASSNAVDTVIYEWSSLQFDNP